MEEQQPSIGRIVHFGFQELSSPINPKVTRCAAIITDVAPDGSVWLKVFHPLDFTVRNKPYPYSSELQANCWTWPPRTP